MKIRYLVIVLFLTNCSTTSENQPQQEMDDNYFKREGALAYVSASYRKPQELVITEKESWGGLKDNQKGTDYLLATGIMPDDDGCQCGSVKVCPGKGLPEEEITDFLPSNPVSIHAINSNNRYYFLRSCDTSPEDLAFFIWGDKSRGNELVQSLGGIQNWKPGAYVTYRSPKNPDAPSLKSFYSDHPGTKKLYTVKKGDSLSVVAYKAYGDIRSWKEIAMENNIQTPDDLEKGMTLVLRYKE